MSQEKIEKLTPEQEALIPVYREKWRKIALSTEPIDKEIAAEAVKEAYALIGLSEPEIIFCTRPDIAQRNIIPQLKELLGKLLLQQLNSELNRSVLKGEASREIDDLLYKQLRRQLDCQLHKQLNRRLDGEGPPFWSEFNWEQSIKPALWALDGCWLDFCITVLTCPYYKNKWLMFKLIVKNCGWIFPFEKIAIICDRPRILSFDNQQRLHAEGAPAIQFADGYSLYAYHGVTLPKKYGNIHPNYWQASWLLKEENAELRRVLIQGIGYERIASELGAIELDSFQEYSLLKIDNNLDEEPIYMLKMTCPSTGYIHVLRVPPDMRSAREAIRWVNWGIDPEEFAVQT